MIVQTSATNVHQWHLSTCRIRLLAVHLLLARQHGGRTGAGLLDIGGPGQLGQVGVDGRLVLAQERLDDIVVEGLGALRRIRRRASAQRRAGLSVRCLDHPRVQTPGSYPRGVAVEVDEEDHLQDKVERQPTARPAIPSGQSPRVSPRPAAGGHGQRTASYSVNSQDEKYSMVLRKENTTQ